MFAAGRVPEVRAGRGREHHWRVPRLLSPTVGAWSLLAIGVILSLVGVLPRDDAWDVWLRVWSVLAFLLLIKSASDLLEDLGVFRIAAAVLVRSSGGRPWVVFAWFCLLATACTTILSLDATVVLLTPVAVTIGRRLGRSSWPFLFASVWLANVASLALPVSNLTNLLAADHLGWSAGEFAARMWPVQVAVLAVCVTVLAVWHRRRLAGRFTVAPRVNHSAAPIVLASVSALVVGVFATLVLVGLPPWLCAAVLVGLLLVVRVVTVWAGAHRPPARRSMARGGLALLRRSPWTMAAFALGLFLLLDPASRIIAGWLGGVLHADSWGSLALMGVLGAGASNLVNNLPAYLALEPSATTPALAAMLLAGTNVGPLITPWASLANLLWLQLCRERGERVPVRAFVVAGAVLVPLLLAGAVVAVRLSL